MRSMSFKGQSTGTSTMETTLKKSPSSLSLPASIADSSSSAGSRNSRGLMAVIFEYFKQMKRSDESQSNKSGKGKAQRQSQRLAPGSELYRLASQGKDDRLHRVLEKFPDKINEIDADQGVSPLAAACRAGMLSTAELLLDLGADIDKRNRYNQTALTLACAKRRVNVAMMLIDRGANVFAANSGGKRALHIACEEGLLALVPRLLELDCSGVDSQDSDFRTPLMYASLTGNTAVMKLLLQKGARTDLRDNRG